MDYNQDSMFLARYRHLHVRQRPVCLLGMMAMGRSHIMGREAASKKGYGSGTFRIGVCGVLGMSEIWYGLGTGRSARG